MRGRLAQYANDLLSLGVDGFRLDAAKRTLDSFDHGPVCWYAEIDIPASDIANILSRLSRIPYITQETIWGAGEPIQPTEYIGNGDAQEWDLNSQLM